MQRLQSIFIPLLFALGCFISRFKYVRSYWLEGNIYMADPDCYTRLFRVKRLLNEHLFIQPWHPFENFPFGIPTHTTAPLDWLISLLAMAFKLIPTISQHAIDWAGFLISPLIAAVTGLLLYYLLRDFKPSWARWPALLTYLLSPLLAWSTSVARPDHQNLIVSLIIIGVALELLRHQKPHLHIWAGLVWGLAAWNSFLEPMVFFTVILVVNLLLRKKEDYRFYLTFIIVVGLTLALEGIRWQAYAKLSDPTVKNWLSNIQETQSGCFIQSLQLGFAVYCVPIFAYLFYRRSIWLKNPSLVFLSIITVILIILNFTQLRWGYFLAAISIFSVFALLPETLKNKYKILIIALHLSPIICWSTFELQNTAPPTAELVSLRVAAENMVKDGKAIMAPWWMSPELLYYSDNPIISSSSHESMDGIIASDLFFTSHSFSQVKELLNGRKVGWIIVGNPIQSYDDAQKTLRGPKYRKNMFYTFDRESLVAYQLYRNINVPSEFQLIYASPQIILYRYNNK